MGKQPLTCINADNSPDRHALILAFVPPVFTSSRHAVHVYARGSPKTLERASFNAVPAASDARASKAAVSRSQATLRLACWDRSSVAVTTTPVGRWVRRTPESVLLRCCPPGPVARNVSTRTSARDGPDVGAPVASGRAATMITELCRRPRLSFTGTRWTRCCPARTASESSKTVQDQDPSGHLNGATGADADSIG